MAPETSVLFIRKVKAFSEALNRFAFIFNWPELGSKNPPAMQETLVHFLGWEDPLEKGKATHSSILVLGVSQEFDTTEQLSWASGEIFKEQIRNTLKINISNI